MSCNSGRNMSTEHLEPPPLDDSEDEEEQVENRGQTQGLSSLLNPSGQENKPSSILQETLGSKDEDEPVLLDEMLAAAKLAKSENEKQKEQEEHIRTKVFGSGMKENMKANLQKEKSKQKDRKARAEKLKERGNECLKNAEYAAAIKLYTNAIEICSDNHVLYSNRAAARLKLKEYDVALEDAEKCIKLDRKWVKGYVRKASALVGLGEIKRAERCFRAAFQVVVVKKEVSALEKVFRSMLPKEYKKYQSEQSMPMLKRDQDKDSSRTAVELLDPETIKESLMSNTEEWANQRLMERILEHPNLAKAMQDPTMAAVLQGLQANPQATLQKFENDAPMMKLLNDFMKVIGDHFIELGEAQEKAQAKVGRLPFQAPIPGAPQGIVSQEEARLQREADKVLENSELREILSDPETKTVLEECAKGKLNYYLSHAKWGPRIRLLGQNGLVKFEG